MRTTAACEMTGTFRKVRMIPWNVARVDRTRSAGPPTRTISQDRAYSGRSDAAGGCTA